jgi:hypothetical protein
MIAIMDMFLCPWLATTGIVLRFPNLRHVHQSLVSLAAARALLFLDLSRAAFLALVFFLFLVNRFS